MSSDPDITRQQLETFFDMGAEIMDLTNRNAQLVAALRALVGPVEAAVEVGVDGGVCTYCYTSPRQNRIQHASNCPVTEGRRVLASLDGTLLDDLAADAIEEYRRGETTDARDLLTDLDDMKRLV